MLFKSKAKIFIFRILDRLPESLGYFLYHLIQNLFSKATLDKKIRASQNSYFTFKRLAEKSGISIQKKEILEIGSGWLPLMPYFFKFYGDAAKIYTYDLNEHYDTEAIKGLNNFFIKELGIEVNSGQNKFTLPDGIEYFPNTNLVMEEKLTADVVFSRFVLEHVRPEDMRKMHKKFKSDLKPGSFIIHFISPGDHRAYDNKNLSLQDFLQYSAKEWDKLHTKFDYHNRWRLPHYVQLFENLGFEIVHLEYNSLSENSMNYQRFKDLKIHSDFKRFSDEELTAGEINIVLKT